MRITTQEAAKIIGLSPRQVTHILERRIIRPEWMPLTGERNRSFAPPNMLMLGISRILYYQFHLSAGETFGALEFLVRENYFATKPALRDKQKQLYLAIGGTEAAWNSSSENPDDLPDLLAKARPEDLESWTLLDRLMSDRRFYLGLRTESPGPDITITVSFRHELERSRESWMDWLTKHSAGLVIDLLDLEKKLEPGLQAVMAQRGITPPEVK